MSPPATGNALIELAVASARSQGARQAKEARAASRTARPESLPPYKTERKRADWC